MESEPLTRDEFFAFTEKVAEFHNDLSPKEQALLAHMTVAGLKDTDHDSDVRELPEDPPPSAKPYYAQVASLLQP
jgi:hypothetical protein